MIQVLKYQAEQRDGRWVVEIPSSATWLHWGVQFGKPTLWAAVDRDSNSPFAVHQLEVYGTGQDVAEGAKYVFTFFEGPFVWHVFDVTGLPSV